MEAVLEKTKPCPDCDGGKIDPRGSCGEPLTCDTCNDSGSVPVDYRQAKPKEEQTMAPGTLDKAVLDVQIGQGVTFVDSKGKDHPALITVVWENEYPETMAPGLNVVYVSDDDNRADTFGRQIERETSIIHESAQPAHGMYWKL